jgi:isoquinoline 1-oxidoreductase beta subunit
VRRRGFLLLGGGIAGGLVVGWALLPARQRLLGSLAVQNGEVALNGWVKVAPDGVVTVLMAKQEMGQGIHTAAAMLLAEELDCDFRHVAVEAAPSGGIYGAMVPDLAGLPLHPDEHGLRRRLTEWFVPKTLRELGLQLTGGSSSVRDLWLPMRAAGAMARATLVAAAANEWHVKPEECSVENGLIQHASGREISYGALIARASSLPLATDYALKDPANFRLIGRAQPRLDSRAKSTGGAGFGCDAMPPGLLHAALTMCPTFGGALLSIDSQEAERLPGVQRIVRVPARFGAPPAVAVIARSYHEARAALAALSIQWQAGATQFADTDSIYRELARVAATGKGHEFRNVGNAERVLAGMAQPVVAEYRAPYLAHAAIEPLNCTVQFKDGRATVWVGTQVPSFARRAVAKTLGISGDDVTLHPLWMGGAFGRRLEVDFIAQAAAIAREAGGAPVRMQWSREDDVRHDIYRPAGVARMTGGLGPDGQLIALRASLAGQEVNNSYVGRVLGLPMPLADKTTAEGVYDQPYEIAHHKVTSAPVVLPVPAGNWRAVGHSHLAFFTESFIDELAVRANRDPLAFRLRLLEQHPRHAAVLKIAADKAGWGSPTRVAADGARTARGIALHDSFGSIVAEVAEVSVDAKRRLRVHRVVCVIECGQVVNPNIVAQQVEGSVIFGLSAALYGEITVAGGQVAQGNFDDFALLRMADCPAIEVHIVPSSAPPRGVGEPAVPPIAPAVANAVFALTGERLRTLPLRLAA